jgi:two-component system chemotaxis response regulator CheY
MKIRFIVIDDAAFLREVIKDIMTSVDSVCIGEADNGEDAIILASATLPDLVFLDMVLPKQNGIDVARNIKSFSPNSQIIACSTIDNPTLIQNALDVGCDKYIKKPFTREHILTTVSQLFPHEGGLAHG